VIQEAKSPLYNGPQRGVSYFVKLAGHLTVLADEVERAIVAAESNYSS
jgi:hypothetical protein